MVAGGEGTLRKEVGEGAQAFQPALKRGRLLRELGRSQAPARVHSACTGAHMRAPGAHASPARPLPPARPPARLQLHRPGHAEDPARHHLPLPVARQDRGGGDHARARGPHRRAALGAPRTPRLLRWDGPTRALAVPPLPGPWQPALSPAPATCPFPPACTPRPPGGPVGAARSASYRGPAPQTDSRLLLPTIRLLRLQVYPSLDPSTPIFAPAFPMQLVKRRLQVGFIARSGAGRRGAWGAAGSTGAAPVAGLL